ncbi:hypothetical protein V2S85_04000 [Novosphingobium resinovorum]|nr:hypothetical protein [Novosphingobium resinovorum]
MLLALTVPQNAASAAPAPLTVGAAVRDTTPRAEWLPLGSTGGTRVVGVLDPVHLRVIALGNGRPTALVVTFEAGGPPEPARFLKGLADHTGIPAEAIYYGATHGHTSPTIAADPKYPASGAYRDFVYAQLLAAADEAIAAMRPARVGIGQTRSYINVNRQGEFTRADGTPYGAQGYNPAGPSDKTLSVVRFEDMAGKPIAFIVHYAVHNTVMYDNRFGAQGAGISSDIGGAVSSAIEAHFPGSVANWIPGASGDQNPILSNEYFTPAIETGEQQTQVMSRAVTELRDFYGKVQFADVLRALKAISPMQADVPVRYAAGDAALPAATAGEPDFAIQLKLLRLGDIALVGNPGEIFNSTGLYLQAHAPARYTLVSNQVRGLANPDIFTSYIPDDYAMIHGGWHAAKMRYKVGTIEPGYAALMNALFDKAR